ALEELERESNSRVWTILQLRVHPALQELKQKLSNTKIEKKYKVKLNYITSRGLWYHYSWKGLIEKSGGISTNIGIHFFDMLIWLFGDVETSTLLQKENDKMRGEIILKNADVEWFLSLDKNDLPEETKNAGKPTFRSITMNDEAIQFSEGFTDLHTRVYEETLKGNGFGIQDARPSIELVQKLRNTKV
ncbi:MAG: Gfo/Idh/MocA family oxidoreductase, partial [Ignavibacteriaceae bacterium]|nr:Gfo/Idh/MocA family oxidoreductase [Ignavibacteriaceae bacterium]